MANTRLSMSIGLGFENDMKASNITFGVLTPGAGDFEFRSNAVDSVNSNQIKRIDMIKALETFLHVLKSGSVFSSEDEG